MAHRRNPEILGEDPVDLGLKALGIAVTSFVNQKVARPIADQLFRASGTLAKAVDVGTTAVSAVGVGELAGLAHRRTGRNLRTGGLILAAGKAVAVPFKGFSVDGRLPDYFNRFPGVSGPMAAPALPAATPLTLAAAGNAPQPFTAYPRPIDSDQDVGL